MQIIISSKVKCIKITESVQPHETVSISIWQCVTSTVKIFSHKTWQTSFLFLKPLQVQNLRIKMWGTWNIISPPPEKSGETHPRDPQIIVPMHSFACPTLFSCFVNKNFLTFNKVYLRISRFCRRSFARKRPLFT